MELDTDLSDGLLTIRLRESRLDAAIATRFKDSVRRALEAGGKTVLMDLGTVDFMDSSGLGALIAVLKSIPPGREFQVMNLQPNVQRVFRLTRMDTVFTIRDAMVDRGAA